MDRFELQREADGTAYQFARVGRHAFERADDPSLCITWEGPLGWVSRLPGQGSIAGRPWDIAPEHQQDSAPPLGAWVSRKGDRSYVYRLVAA